MKSIIRSVTAALLLIFTVFTVSAADKYPQPTDRFFVNDFADVIDSAAEDEIYSRAVALQEQTTAQAVVITVDTLDGEPASDYALGIGRQWGVGQKDEDNGVVILLALQEREIYISIGYGLEGALPDSKTGRIIDTYGLDYLKKDDFSTGLLEISKSVINEIYIEYGIEPEAGYTGIDDSEEGTRTGKVAASWAALAAFVILYVLVFGRRGFGLFVLGGRGGFGGHGGFSGRGGFGGGGFSGGGGSFGGGGAGRGF